MLKKLQIIDLSRTLQIGEPESSSLPRATFWWYALQEWGDSVNFQAMLISEHTGTNVDAPRHVLPDGMTIDELPIDAFIGPAILLDISHLEPLAEITPLVIQESENRSANKIRKGDITIFMTKHDERHWQHNPNGYKELRKRPAFNEDAAEYLTSKGVKAIGMDTTSPDVSGTKLPVHRLLLKRGVFIIEALCNLDKIPQQRFLFIALPLKIHSGSGSPVRAVAIAGELSYLMATY